MGGAIKEKSIWGKKKFPQVIFLTKKILSHMIRLAMLIPEQVSTKTGELIDVD